MLGAYLLVAAAAASPIAEMKTFRDWVVGCDNGRLCQASAMAPEGGAIGATLTVRRGPEGAAIPDVWFHTWEVEASDLAADGKPLRLRIRKTQDEYQRDGYAIDRADAVRLLDALRAAKLVEVIDRSGNSAEAISVNGATAALLYIDEQQRRLDTQGALVRRGPKPSSSVPAPPALPVRKSVKRSPKPPAKLSHAFIAKVRKDNDCAEETDAELISHDRLDSRHTLAIITLRCLSGAYNFISENYVITDDGGPPREARFDDNEGREEGDMLHYNLFWDAKARRLHAGFKGRGIGDCGGRQEYVWDGLQFRLVAVSGMDDCRGVGDFISLWRARVIER
jgi:hypothetical protein